MATFPHKRRKWGQWKPGVGFGLDPSHPLAQGLVGCWLFNEGGGGLTNICLNATTSIAGSPSWGTGSDGLAKTYSGTSQSETVPDHPSLDFSGDITFVARLKTSVGASGQHIYGGYSISSPFIGIGLATGFVGGVGVLCYWSSAKGSWVAGTTVLSNGAWRSGAVSVVSGTANFYLDGKADGSVASAGSVSFASNKVIAARSDGTAAWNGSLAQLLIYTRGLSAAEIQWLYAEPYAMVLGPTMRRFYSVPAAGGAAVQQNLMLLGCGSRAMNFPDGPIPHRTRRRRPLFQPLGS